MVGGGQPLVSEILGQTDPVPSRTPIFKAHSHQARLRPSASVDARRRTSTSVDARRRTDVYANMEHMLKSLRVHTKRVYVRRRT